MRAAALVILVVALAGCGRPGADREKAARGTALTVATTTRQLADFARRVGGDRVYVEPIIPANADPHDFEPRPSDARLVASADVVLRSGGEIDAWLGDLVDNAGGDARVVDLDAVVRRRGSDPHWWQDPQNVERAVGRIAAVLSDVDPDGAADYAAGARRYEAELRALDRRIAACLRPVPAARRTLVTSHDAFGYFADRYGIRVLGSILPALSTSAQPSAGDIRRLVADIRRAGVTTIFPESALSERLERAVARDAHVRVGAPLYADTLGPRDDGTYLGVLAHDAELIAASMGARCQL